jgi:hypothetical protein
LQLVVVLAAAAAARLQSAGSACDPLLKQDLEHPQGYRDRSDQVCEGVYATDVSSTGLTLASFTGPLRSIDLSTPAEFSFIWKAVGEGEVRIRADSLRPRFYYRLDAIRPAGDGRLSWSNGIPSQYGLRTAEFGVLATLRNPARAGDPVYLPLSIMSGDISTPVTPYIVTVRSGADIEEVYWSLSKQGEDGFITYDEALGYSPYPAGQPVGITLDRLHGPGLYQLTVSAELRGGLRDSLAISFLHAD